MSEIIFPSEIISPAEIDWENSIANALVSAGVGIFFTDDNLTTVTNVATGVVGTGTDITNNELGTVSNGYRIGTVITGLTSEQQTSVTDNPYQLLKTKEKAEQEYGLKLATTSEQITFPLIGAWAGTLTYADDTTSAESGTGNFTLDGTTEKHIISFNPVDTVQSHFWEFNQTKGDTATDHINSVVATLSGFPADSGYIVEGGLIVGYQFGGSTTALLVMTGAYTGTITYFDDTTLAISGSGNYTVDNTHVKAIKTIVATDTVDSYNWDATTGDDTKIIDTVGNNHATITNASTVKWQEIVPKSVFTIGDVGNTLYDYELTSSMIDAVKNIDGHVVLNIMENCTISAVFVDAGNYTLTIDGQMPFNGNENDTVNNRFIDATAASNRAFLMYQGATFKNMLIDPGSVVAWQNAKEKTIIDSVGLVSSTTTSLGVSASSGSEITLKNSKINSIDISASSSQEVGSTVNFINSLATSRSVVRNYGTLNVQNGIFTNSDWVLNIYTGSVTNVSNSRFAGSTTTDTTDLGGNIFNVDMSTWFDVNNQITADGQTALVGNGWNGSDIASWAYYSAPTAVEGVVSFSLPNLVVNSSGTATLPQPIGNASFTVNKPLFTSVGSATLPQPVGAINLTLSAPSFIVSGSASLPQLVGSASFTIDSPTFSASGSATTTAPSGSISITINKPVFIGSGAATLPSPIGGIDVGIPAPIFALTGSVTIPTWSASGNITLNKPLFSVTGSTTLPQPIGSVELSLTSPVFNVSGSVSGIVIINGTDSTITLEAKLNLLTLETKSNTITL